MVGFSSMFKSVLLLPVLCLVSQATANPFLNARQSEPPSGTPYDVNHSPPECKASCSIVDKSITSCRSDMPKGCGCSIEVERALFDCGTCTLKVGGGDPPAQTSIDLFQETLDRYVTFCAADGIVLPTTTISGGISKATFPASSGGSTSPATTTGSSTNTAAPTGSSQQGSNAVRAIVGSGATVIAAAAVLVAFV